MYSAWLRFNHVFMAAINSDWDCNQNLELTLFTKFTDLLPYDLLYCFTSDLHLIRKKIGLCGCTFAVFALQRKNLGCVKTSQNFRKICLFQLAKFCILAAKFEN